MTHQAESIEAQERNEVSIRRSSTTRSPIDKNNKVDIAKLLNPEKELSKRDQLRERIYQVAKRQRAEGILIEENYIGSPASEEEDKSTILEQGHHLYYQYQHRAILHTVLLWHLQGRPRDVKVSTPSNSISINSNFPIQWLSHQFSIGWSQRLFSPSR